MSRQRTYVRDINLNLHGAPGPMPYFGPEVSPEASPIVETCDHCGIKLRPPINVEIDDPLCDACLESSRDPRPVRRAA